MLIIVEAGDSYIELIIRFCLLCIYLKFFIIKSFKNQLGLPHFLIRPLVVHQKAHFSLSKDDFKPPPPLSSKLPPALSPSHLPPLNLQLKLKLQQHLYPRLSLSLLFQRKGWHFFSPMSVLLPGPQSPVPTTMPLSQRSCAFDNHFLLYLLRWLLPVNIQPHSSLSSPKNKAKHKTLSPHFPLTTAFIPPPPETNFLKEL